MKMSMLRQVDSWIGVPLTLVLTLARKCLGWTFPVTEGPVKSILFVKLAEQGSTVLAYGAILRAVEMVGSENVYFLAFDNNRFIVDALDLIPEKNVITIDESSLIIAMISSLKAVFRMHGQSIDAAIDMEFFARSSAVFTLLSGARRRVGLHRYAGGGAYRGDLMTHRLVYNPHLHTSQVFYSMVEALKCSPDTFPSFPLKVPALDELALPSHTSAPDEITSTRAIIREAVGREDVPPLILININCSDLLPLRKWDTENYVRLAQGLLEQYEDLYIGVTGAPDEAEGAEQVVRTVGSPQCVSFAGKTSMEELLTLYSLARVLVTNDSGPAHFATLTSIQTLTLFGPETPMLFAANSLRSHTLWAGLACSPCVSAYNNRVSCCDNNLCMQAITVEQVLAETCELYESDNIELKNV
ncbi:MAG: glycosyltransferase family 9 protein [Halioglobus sp.]